MHAAEVRPQAAGDDSQRAGWLLVAAQAALLAASAAARPRAGWRRPAGIRAAAVLGQVAGLGVAACAALSLRRALSALPYPNARTELRTGGLFARVRHPIYSGLLLAVTARAMGSGRPAQWGVAAALGVLFEVKAHVEENAMAQRFPTYGVYAARTGRLLPRVRAQVRSGG